jgi:beta-lactamase regulating signal transducer with metallopeptidase domain
MIGWALETLVASTLLMLLVLIAREPVRRAFGSGVAYLLWLLPLARMVLPPLPASWRESAAAPIAAPLIHAGDAITVLMAAPLGLKDAVAPAIHQPSSGLIFAGLWALGAVLFLGWHWIAHLRFCRRMLMGSHGTATIAGSVRVLASDAAPGPLAFGVLRRYVAFPADFTERYDPDERDLALAHELGHHVRGDLLANWTALIVLSLHWFNPVAWRAFRAFRADQEMANDAWVLRGREAAFRHAYGRAIVKSAHGGAISTACHLHSVHALKRRLRMLSMARKSRARTMSGGAMVGVLAVVGLGITASGTQAAEGLRAKVCNTVCDTIGIALPAPVAATGGVAAPAAVQSVDAPPPPPVPPAAIVPAAPPAHPAPVVDARAIRAQADAAMNTVPEISSGTCGTGGSADQMVLSDRSGGHERLVICQDRIDAAARQGARIAANSAEIRRSAYRAAHAGLQSARSAVNSAQISEEARREALASIDKAAREIQDDLADGAAAKE